MANADRIIELFHAAKARPPGAERDHFLAESCPGDAALREQIISLLAADAAEGDSDFLKLTGNLRPTIPSEKPGDRIGRYKLLQQIGEGGCGVVYMAEQEEPVRRRVALKVIKLGMDTKQVIARFEAERQALALMDHPNIAKIFDAGVTGVPVAAGILPAVEPGVPPGGTGVDDSRRAESPVAGPGGKMPPSTAGETPAATLSPGRPFFVMELVRGIKITEYCDQNHLPTNERLKLFIQVCQAIQHAHQKGIIHRDIKPSNILVTHHDDVAVPKVIDFGIAKATVGQLTDKTVFTAFAQFIGTPAYMSPEQAQMSGLDIDTRADIYSLGVLLYELLTGSPPFDQKELLAAGLDEMRRTIREVEPAKPSTRLTQELVAADVSPLKSHPESAQNFRGDSRRLLQEVTGDLDWIVMKCLEKDRARRYETANGLATDVQRHLDSEPVNARPPSGLYRLQKLVRRNQTAFAAAAAVAVILVIGAIVSTSQAIRATRAEREQSGLRQQADTANRELRDTVSLLELQRAEDQFSAHDAAAGVAHLAAILRHDPSNHLAASRLVSTLVHRNWALPSATMQHLDRVMTAGFSPNGRHVLSASWDKTAQVWDASTGESLATVRHQDLVLSARYNRAGDRFVTASADDTAQICSATNGVPVAPPLRHAGKVYWAEFSPDGRSVVTASADETAAIWSAATGAVKHELRGHDAPVLFARFSPDGERVATATQSGTIRIWRVDSGEMLARMDVHRERINALDFSPDGSALVSGSADCTARLWNPTNGHPLGAPLLHPDLVQHVVFSPDGGVVLTTSPNNVARLWNARNGNLMGQPLLHEGEVIFGAFSPDGQMVVTTSMDNSARLWEVSTGMPICQPLREHEAMLHASFSPDGRRLVTASWNQNVQIWNIQSRRYLGIEMSHEKRVTSVTFDQHGKRVLSASLDHTARLWDARTGQALGQPMRHQAAVNTAEFTVDGRRVVTASDDNTACVWDAGTGQVLAGPLRHAKPVWSAQFSPDGARVVTASADGTARLWDARTGEPATPPLEHGAAVKVARFSPDGRWVVTASENWSARVWNAQTGEPVTERLPHGDHVQWAEFSFDNERVISASSDNTARIWEVRTGRPIGPPLQHARTVQKAVFSPDGRLVATASLDRTVRIWDAQSGEALTNPLTHDRSVSQVCFSPDGRRILTSCWAGKSRLWDADTSRPLTEWLDAGGFGFSAFFDATGRRMVSGATTGSVRVWDVPLVPTPVPPWFLGLAEAVAGRRLKARNNVELVSRQEFEAVVLRLARMREASFYERLARWFLADPSDRPASPF